MNFRDKVILIATMLGMLFLTGVAFAQSGDGEKSPVQKTWTMKPSRVGHTLPLYQLQDKYVSPGFREAEPVRRPSWLQGSAHADRNFRDEALQQAPGPQISLTLGMSFDGIGQGLVGPQGTYSVGSVPPDTDMAVGTTQVVSLDNTGFAVFNKATGAVTAGPYNTNVLWSSLGTGSGCDTNNDGDGVVKFDQLAQRWIITQFSVSTTPYRQCFAISTTADATGSWTVFQFTPPPSGDFPDYPKLGVWPNAYLLTFDMFNAAGTSYIGGTICGIDRIALLGGSTSPTVVCAALTSSDYALLPVDLDGSAYPPAANTKALFVEQSGASGSSTSLFMYRAAYNFVAGTVAVDSRITMTVSTYNNATCSNTSKCAPQPPHTGTVQNGTFVSESKLDTLAAHEMFRAAYRNFGTYESITLSGPVLPSGSGGTGSNTAERWYEIRTPFGTPTIFQQSTFSPDTTLFRWMGSIAQDRMGNMAMGYSGSSTTVFPSIYVTGRLNGDTLNTMESETQLYAGLNSQVNLSGEAYAYRWGDYTAMMPDPNDCTFWFTGEYLKQAGLFNWSTRILSFSFPNCSSTAALTSPIPSSTLPNTSSVNFLWMASNVATNYWLDIGKEPGGNEYYQSGSLSATTFAAAVNSLPKDGSTIYATLYSLIGGSWVSTPYTFTAYSPGTAAVITTPTPNSTLTGSSVTFTWTAAQNATAYWIDAGSSAGTSNYYQSGNLGNVLTKAVNGLPTNGSSVYVTLYSLVAGNWLSNAYTYTAYNLAAAGGILTTPAPGSTLTSSSVAFGWTAGAGASAYWLDVGSTAGGNQYYQSGNLGNVLTKTVNNLPADGSTVYVTLYSLIGGTWSGNAYTYTALSGGSCTATITAPAQGSTLGGSSQLFSWTPSSNPGCSTSVTGYWLDAGILGTENFYYQSGNLGLATSNTAINLPTASQNPGDPPTVYMTLWNLVGGVWQASPAVTYAEAP